MNAPLRPLYHSQRLVDRCVMVTPTRPVNPVARPGEQALVAGRSLAFYRVSLRQCLLAGGCWLGLLLVTGSAWGQCFGPATDYGVGKTPYGVGKTPYSVAVGDVNADGRADIITANANSDDVSVLLGQSGGGFGAPINYGVGSGPFSVTVGDVNADGRADIITANADSDDVSVLLGRSGGGFGAPTNYGVGSGPFSVAVGDVNADGRADIITANTSSDNVSVLLGRSGGGFGAPTNYGVGDAPISVAVGDVNADGRADIITANLYGNDVSVLLGQSGGGFGAPTNYGTGGNPFSVAVGDVNADGRADIITANVGSNNVSVLLNGGAPPTIISQSQSATTICAGNVVEFSYAFSFGSGGGRADFYRDNTFLSPVSSSTGNVTSSGSRVFNIDQSGSYQIVVTSSCTSVTTTYAAIVVNPMPTAYNVTGGGPYCTGGTGVVVGLAGSQTGVNYQLLRDGNAVGSAVAGTGSALSFGNQTAVGTYTVRATNATTACQQAMSGSVSLTVNPLPTQYAVTGGGSFCTGAAGIAIGLTGSQTGVDYQLLRGGNNVGSSVAGTGSVLSFGNQTVAGTYTVLATRAGTACPQIMTGSATVTANSTPVVSATNPAPVCSPAIVNLNTAVSSDIPVSFAFFTNPELTTSVANPGAVATSGTYYVQATGQGGCVSDAKAISVTVNALLVVSITGLASAYCKSAPTVTLSGSPTGGSFTVDGALATQFAPGDLATGNHTVAYSFTNSNGCTNATTQSVSVNPLPVAGLINNGPFSCSTTSVTLTASGGTAYRFSSGVNQVGSGPTAMVSSGGIYSVTVVASSGCTSVASSTVVGEPSVPPAIISQSQSATTICAGEGVNFYYTFSFGSGGGRADFYRDNTFLRPLESNPTNYTSSGGRGFAILQSGSYQIVVTSACTSVTTTYASILVNPLPTSYSVTGGGDYCAGSAGSVVGLLGSQIGVSYQLLRDGMPTGTAVAGTNNPISFGPQSVIGPYNVLATNTSTACSQFMSGTAIVSGSSPLPTPTLVGSGTLTCALTAVTLTAGGGSVGAPFTYAFSAGASQFGGSSANTATVVASGPYSVTVTTPYGCSATTTTTVSSNTTAPAVSISPSASAICAGQTVTLAATPGLMTYQWSNGQATASISVSATGTYSVTATTSNGCSATAVASVRITPLPAVSITPSSTAICAGQAVTLSATPGLNSYQWNTTQTTATISVSAAGPYSVTVTDANGCSNTTIASVTINPLPTSYSVIGGGTYCAGDAGSAVGLPDSQTGVSYQLQRGGTATGTAVAGTDNPITFGPQNIAGTYTVLATNISTACTQSMSGSVVVSTIAVPTVSISPSATAVCAGQSATFSATPGLTYRWIGPGGGPMLTTATISASVAGSYSLTVTNVSGCTATATASLTVNSLPTVSIAPPAATLCAGQSTTLMASGADTYKWSTTQTTASLSVSMAGPYSVTGTATSTGCSNTATASVTVTPLPNATFSGLPPSICVDALASTLTPTTPGGSFSGPGISGNQFSPATATAGGPYSIIYSVSNMGCPNSSVQPVTVNPLPVAPLIATQSGHSYPGGISSLTISQNTGNVILMTSGCIDGTITWAGGSSNTLAVSTFNSGVQTFTATCTSNATGCTSPKGTATVTVVGTTLSVLHRDGNGNVNTNTLSPYLQLQNDGNTAIPYSEITVRYWLTVENYAPLLYSINYAQLGSDKVHLKYVPASTGNPTATGYIEFSFDAAAGSLGAMSNSGPIQDLINKQDYSSFDQRNDYSYAPVGQFTPNNRITAYRNGVLFYGLEPGPVAPMQSVKAMLQNNTGEGANSIEAVLSVTNDGNIPINYGDIKVRYYFTADNKQSLVLSQVGYTALGSGNVSAQIATISPALAGADRYLELSFSPGLGQLAPGASTGGVTYQIHHGDYSGFNQTNDYSYQGTGRMMVNPHVVVFVAGQRAYGTEPGTGARQGVEENTGHLAVQVLGNPVTGSTVSVSVRGAEGQWLRYELWDVRGQVVGERQVESAGAVDQQSLSVSHQSAGLLLLRVSTPTQSQTVKVLRQ